MGVDHMTTYYVVVDLFHLLELLDVMDSSWRKYVRWSYDTKVSQDVLVVLRKLRVIDKYSIHRIWVEYGE